MKCRICGLEQWDHGHGDERHVFEPDRRYREPAFGALELDCGGHSWAYMRAWTDYYWRPIRPRWRHFKASVRFLYWRLREPNGNDAR